MSNIDDTYNKDYIHLFKKSSSKYIICEKTIQKLKKVIKENIKEPNKDIDVYLIKFKINLNSNYPIIISCAPYIITEKLNLITNHDDVAITIKYSSDELKKYGYKKNHISKIINAVKNNKISFNQLTENITNILNI
jgi:hypothetical protein